jgi:hypothetical protein
MTIQHSPNSSIKKRSTSSVLPASDDIEPFIQGIRSNHAKRIRRQTKVCQKESHEIAKLPATYAPHLPLMVDFFRTKTFFFFFHRSLPNLFEFQSFKSFLYLMSSAHNNSVEVPKGATDAVLVQSEEMPADTPLIEGPDFNKVLSLSDLLATYKHMGFQASGLGKAIDIVEKMVS